MGKKKRDYSRNAIDNDWLLSEKRIDRQLSAIAKEYKRRTLADDENFNISNNERPNNFLKREIYWLGKQILRRSAKWDAMEYVRRKRAIATTRPEKLENVFRALLTGLFPDETIHRQQRSDWTSELNYAHRHKVPAKLLCGFLLQSGPTNILKTHLVLEGYTEPAFQDRDPPTRKNYNDTWE